VKKTTAIIFGVLFALGALSRTALAIPAFARKHGFNCAVCHVAFPKLNDWGQRFRDNGYQIPGQQGGEKTVFEGGAPLALRTTTGYSFYATGGESAAGFHLYGLDLLAGGVLHKNISFFFVYTPRIDEPAADWTGPSGGSSPAQLAAVESANIVFSNLIQDKLNIRIGRFEPGFQLLSSKRLYYVLQPFEIYNFAGPAGFDFSANPIGIEATGRFKPGWRYAVGIVNGTGANPDNNALNDLYFSLAKTFGPGDGQSAGQRLGVFGYLGWQPTDFASFVVSPVGDAGGKGNKSFYRLGGNLSLNWNSFNLQGLAFRGVDDRAFNVFDPKTDYQFWGGVLQLDWAGLPNNRLVGSLMYNWVRPPGSEEARRLDAFSVLGRYYLGSWLAVNVAVHAEYTHRVFGTGDDSIKDDLFTILLDFDF